MERINWKRELLIKLEQSLRSIAETTINWRFAISMVISFIALSCNFNHAVDPEFLIIPGEGAGVFKINEKLPDTAYNKNELQLLLKNKDTIISIRILSDKFRTKDNIGIGSNYKDVIEVYGDPLPVPRITKGSSVINEPIPIEDEIPYELWYYNMYFGIDTLNRSVNSILVYKFEGEWPFR